MSFTSWNTYHIHAIAIGDQELSAAANEQLVGESGYFRGYDGLPVPTGGSPKTDMVIRSCVRG